MESASTTPPSDPRTSPGHRPTDVELVAAARAALERSYSPYSGFRVGAALATADGRIVTGANVENSSFGLTICAERAAVVRAVAEGALGREAIPLALAVAVDADEIALPCGACRQVLAEFAPDLPVLAVARGNAVHRTSLSVLLPDVFRL